ncbi:MAG: AAA family ATPase [Actinomycetota bacterium]
MAATPDRESSPTENTPESLLEGFRVAGFRSIYDTVSLHKLDRINLIIGPNNSGKSNILRFVERVLARHSPGGFEYKGLPEDRPLDAVGLLSFGLLLPGDFWSGPKPLDDHQKREAGKWTDEVGLTADNGALIWIDWELQDTQRITETLRPSRNLPDNLWDELQVVGNAYYQRSLLETFFDGRPSDWTLPPIVSIPASRWIGPASADEDQDWAGAGLFGRLAALQNPAAPETEEYKQARQDWSNYRDFVASVLEDDHLTIEVPRAEDTIHITMDGRTMRVEALGSGIHQLLMIAAACVLTRDSLILVEEPEVHLHPLLLRRLGAFLLQSTTNQYIIATHSPHLIDMPHTRVFRTRLENGRTVVESVERSDAVLSVLADLGYRASDVLQANCVVWVEGPSDRVYVKHWLERVDPELLIDVHYSIMFYGGTNIRSTSGAADEVEVPADLVRLRKVNQYSVLIADSDKRNETDKLKPDLAAVVKSFEDGGMCWITEGREVENYVDPDDMLAAIKSKSPKAKCLQGDGDPFERRYSYVGGHGAAIVDPPEGKPALARSVVAIEPKLDVLDLEERLVELSTFIRRANGLARLQIAADAPYHSDRHYRSER